MTHTDPATIEKGSAQSPRNRLHPQGEDTLMKTKHNGLLRLIAIFKLVKALTLSVVGFGALRLTRDSNAADAMTRLAGRFGLNPGVAWKRFPEP